MTQLDLGIVNYVRISLGNGISEFEIIETLQKQGLGSVAIDLAFAQAKTAQSSQKSRSIQEYDRVRDQKWIVYAALIAYAPLLLNLFVSKPEQLVGIFGLLMLTVPVGAFFSLACYIRYVKKAGAKVTWLILMGAIATLPWLPVLYFLFDILGSILSPSSIL
jgi:hypothetical protein